MNIADKFKKLVQSEEPSVMIMRGTKYKSVKNGWVPILNAPTASIIDFSRTESSKR